MHIPDGVLPITHCVIYFLLVTPFLIHSLLNIKRSSKAMTRTIAMAALVFAASFFSIPIVFGIRDHFLLIPLAAILYGPHTALLAGFIALLLQASLQLEGGLTTLGANTLSMGIGGGYLTYYIFRIFRRLFGDRRRYFTAGLTGFLGVLLAALLTGLFVTLAFTLGQIPVGKVGMPETAFLPQAIIVISVVAWFIPVAILEGIITAVLVKALRRTFDENRV